MTRLRLAALALALASRTASADTIDDRGLPVEEKCAYCHGYDGNSRMARFPRLAGQDYRYLVKQLRDFRSGRRRNDGGVMATNVEQLGEADIRRAARHFSRQTRARPAYAKSPTLGERLFRIGRPGAGIPACAPCHAGPRAGAAGPRIFGQHGDYVAKQLSDFRNGARANDADAVMRGIASKLGDAEIQALARYLETAGPER